MSEPEFPLLFVHSPPQGTRLGSFSAADVPLPAFSFGKPIMWHETYAPPPVFIGQVSLQSGAELFVFGVRYDLKQRTDLPPDAPEPTGFFINFVVAECFADGTRRIHVLSQWRSSTYQSGQDAKDHIFANEIKKKDLAQLCLGEPPKWKAYDAQWPRVNDSLMSFVAQFALPEIEVTRQWLTFNTGIFLFTQEIDGRSVFKITTQDTKYQSAEDHYRAEARRIAKKEKGKP
jgi:hypothetical protein